MAWTKRELEILEATSRISSTFSLMGASFIIITFCSSTSFHRPINRLAFFAAFGNILTNVATITSRRGINHGTGSGLCRVQATFIQWFMPADALFCFAMALNVYLTVFKKYTTKRLKSLEVTYICICYGVPFIPAIVFLFPKDNSGVPIYGSATLWCWISSEWQLLRIACFYGPVWIMLVLTLAIYILAGRVIFNLRGSLRQFVAGESPSHMYRPSGPSGPTRDTLGRVPVAHTLPLHQETKLPVAANPFIGYSCTISSGAERSSFSISRTRNSSVEANTAAWAYCRCAMLFFLALLITWLPSSINRIYNLIYPDATNFGLNFAAALVLPCQGFWNGLIYSVTTLAACKEFFSNIWKKTSSPFRKLGRRMRAGRRHSKASSLDPLSPT